MATKPPKIRLKLSRMSEDEARGFLEGIRWPHGPVCPHCGSQRVTRLQGKATRPGVFKCKEKGCRKQFTVSVGTIFQGSHIALRDWVYAFHRMCASKKGVSALQLQRELECSYRTAWFLCHRIRYAMAADPLRGMLQGTVEMDETYVGGKPRNPRSSAERWQAKASGQPIPYSTKTPVVALVQREGRRVAGRH
jgi:transposase-like protein